MQITVEDQSSIKKTLRIEIPQETVIRELDDTYKEVKKNAKIKGFRPGKVPVSILKRHYKEKVHADVAYQLIQKSLPEAVKEKELNVIGEPVIDPEELQEEAPFTYSATVEVKPEIAEINYKGFDLKKVLYKHSDEEIENQLTTLQNNFAEEQALDSPRPAAKDDIAFIDFEGFFDGQPFPEFPKTEKTKVSLGTGFISEAFDAQLIGMTPGETKTFTVDFPEDAANEVTAGKTISFEVTLHELKEKSLPVLDDAFATKLGPYETIDNLKEEIAKNLQAGYDKQSEQELNEQAFEKLLEQCDFEVPEAMVRHELDGIMEEIERTYSNYNLSIEALGQSQDALRETYRETAEKQAKRHIILNKIIEQDALTLDDDALETGFQEIADSMQQPVDMIKQFYQQRPEQIDVLRYSLLEKKAMELVLENSKIEEVAPDKAEAATKSE
jgi:trigger factor